MFRFRLAIEKDIPHIKEIDHVIFLEKKGLGLSNILFLPHMDHPFQSSSAADFKELSW